MSVIIAQEPHPIPKQKANALHPGTWFVEQDGQVYVIVLDDRTLEKRILCLGHQYRPFLINISPDRIDVSRILQVGTLLQITDPIRKQESAHD